MGYDFTNDEEAAGIAADDRGRESSVDGDECYCIACV
jgi:hypothetical protein